MLEKEPQIIPRDIPISELKQELASYFAHKLDHPIDSPYISGYANRVIAPFIANGTHFEFRDKTTKTATHIEFFTHEPDADFKDWQLTTDGIDFLLTKDVQYMPSDINNGNLTALRTAITNILTENN